jgi:hypothetical protein
MTKDKEIKEAEPNPTPEEAAKRPEQPKEAPTDEKAEEFIPATPNVTPSEKHNPNAMEYNGETNTEEHSVEEKEKLEKELSKDNIVARVVSWSGKYLKVKFLKDNKPFSVYKGKSGSVEDAKLWRDEAMDKDEKVTS